MRNFVISIVIAVFVFLLNGCAGTTPIKNLALPPVSTIEGHITQLDESGFTLMDNTGSIYVRAESPDNRKLNLSVDEKVKVYGNLQGGQKKYLTRMLLKSRRGSRLL